MHARDIMTKTPACCTPETRLTEVAKMMVDKDCGEIPVVQSSSSRTLVGVVTDRDIACRAVAVGRNPLELCASDVMSTPVITVPMDADLDECCKVMEAAQVRRIPVVDHSGSCCGIISQADVARRGSESQTSEMVRDISRPGGGSSRAREVAGA